MTTWYLSLQVMQQTRKEGDETAPSPSTSCNTSCNTSQHLLSNPPNHPLPRLTKTPQTTQQASPQGISQGCPTCSFTPDPPKASPLNHPLEGPTAGQQNGPTTSPRKASEPPAPRQRAPPPPANNSPTPPQPRAETTPRTQRLLKDVTIFVDALNPKEVHSMLRFYGKFRRTKSGTIHGKRQQKLKKKYPERTSHEPDYKKYRSIMVTTPGGVIHLTKNPIKSRAKYHWLEIKNARKPRKSFEKELVELIEKLEGEL